MNARFVSYIHLPLYASSSYPRYWYASPTNANIPDLQGAGGGTFLAGALEDGFLKAPNRDKLKFALMWANQDWVDIHPAKKGWNACYRPAKSDPIYGPGK